MRQIILILTFFATILSSCQKDEISIVPDIPSEETAEVAIDLIVDNLSVVDLNTRALTPEQEQRIGEVNIYCFNKVTNKCERMYATGVGITTLKVNLGVGTWDIYVTANNGRVWTDIRSEVENMIYTINSEAEFRYLPMSGKITTTITGHMRVPISLTRIVSKVDATVTVASSLSGKIRLKNISVVNAPKSCALYSKNAASNNLISYNSLPCVNGAKNTFYIFENAQGINSSITNQK